MIKKFIITVSLPISISMATFNVGSGLAIEVVPACPRKSEHVRYD